MPFKHKDVLPTEVKNITDVNIYQIIIDVEGQKIHALYSIGYEDNGSYIPVVKDMQEFSGSDFVALAGKQGKPDKNLYDNIKEAIYPALAQKKGWDGDIV